MIHMSVLRLKHYAMWLHTHTRVRAHTHTYVCICISYHMSYIFLCIYMYNYICIIYVELYWSLCARFYGFEVPGSGIQMCYAYSDTLNNEQWSQIWSAVSRYKLNIVSNCAISSNSRSQFHFVYFVARNPK